MKAGKSSSARNPANVGRVPTRGAAPARNPAPREGTRPTSGPPASMNARKIPRARQKATNARKPIITDGGGARGEIVNAPTKQVGAVSIASNAQRVAPSAMAGGINLGADWVRNAKRQFVGNLRTLTAESLACALEQFDYGNLSAAAALFEQMADRDMRLSGLRAKREKSVARRPWQVITPDENAPGAQQHKETLEFFWNNVRAESAWDRNERGGFSRLIRQMMSAVSFRYAVHHIVWQPGPDGLSALFEFVPLRFFENTTGRMRFLRSGFGLVGEPMEEQNWLTTCHDGIMVACSIGFFAKRGGFQDWQIFVEKFSVPGLLGITDAAPNSAQWDAVVEMARTFSSDWAGVCSTGTDLKTIQVTGDGPMPALIDYIDRAFSSLYRGADLSSMSAGKDAAGDGASLQGSEGDLLERDDAALISETLHEIERRVIEWKFGPGTTPLAYLEIIVPERRDQVQRLAALKTLVDMGVAIAKDDAREEFGFSAPDDGEEVLGAAAQDVSPTAAPDVGRLPSAGGVPKTGAQNAVAPEFLAACLQAEAVARNADMAPLAAEFRKILGMNDPAAAQAALTALNARLPDFLNGEPASVAAWQDMMASAFCNGLAPTAGSGDPAYKIS